MIEDALKSARNLHRLIIAVSLITLVFSLSLNLPPDKIRLKEAIDRLIDTDFLEYDTFVQDKVNVYAAQNLTPIAQKANESLEALNLQIFHLHHIGEALGTPLHVGKILTKELVFADITAASLVQLDAMNGLDLGRDIQVLKPKTQDLMEALEPHLLENGQGTKRLETLRVGIDEFDFTAQSFVPGSTAMAGMYFELHEGVLHAAAPTFNASFNTEVETLPDTSFLYWVKNVLKSSDVVAVENNRLVFLPELTNIPRGFREEKLGTLSLRLADEIKSTGPEELSATILGTEVPGLLIVIASPTILFFLSYYFMQHTAHLRGLVIDDLNAFRHFAWLPLALGRVQTIQSGKSHTGFQQAWQVETVATSIILPVLALLILYVQLDQFGTLKNLHTFLIAGASFSVILMGATTLRHIDGIRLELTHSSDYQNNKRSIE